MKNKSMLKILFLSLILSSCGLTDKFKTTDQPTDSNESTASTEENVPTEDALAGTQPASEPNVDDLFGDAMSETSAATSGTDGAINPLETDFSAAGPAETKITEKTDVPVIVQESLPSINQDMTPPPQDAGTIKNYTVKKGETLMQIAFTIYGDVSKWKDIKSLNNSNSNHLKSGMTLKYRAPAQEFVWNPIGTPHLIKTGETLGTISNSVYATPKKWKSIWENNKPLIKNPNLIYAGFTLYYKTGNSMANYVQPKAVQPKPTKEALIIDSSESETSIVKTEEVQVDEAIQSLAAPERTEKREVKNEAKEIDLINNVTAPIEHDDLSPDIDEEIQTL